MYRLHVEPLDLGPEVRAVAVSLVVAEDGAEPVRGSEGARVWSRVLPAIVGEAPWTLDFFSHLDRAREFCERQGIAFREAGRRTLLIPAPGADALESLLSRFKGETFGARGGGILPAADPELEGELSRRGVDAYHTAFPGYLFCAVCEFEDGSLVLLSEKLLASEVIRRVRPVLRELEVEVNYPA